MSNSQMQRYLSFPTSTHHPLCPTFDSFQLISLLLMIKNYLLNCLSYLQSNPKVSANSHQFSKLTLDLKTFVSKKSLQSQFYFLFSVIYTITTVFNIWNIYNVYTKISDISVNENFDFSYKKIFQNLKFTNTKTTIFLIKKKQTTPNLQFAGDVKFAGDNPIDPLSNPRTSHSKLTKPHLLVKQSQ